MLHGGKENTSNMHLLTLCEFCTPGRKHDAWFKVLQQHKRRKKQGSFSLLHNLCLTHTRIYMFCGKTDNVHILVFFLYYVEYEQTTCFR